MKQKLLLLVLFLLLPRLFHGAPAGENVIILTTVQAVGDKINLQIKAEGGITIEGATGTFVNDAPVEYTLTAQTVTLRGTVPKLDGRDNLLTALDVSGNPALTWLDCTGNRIKGDAMTALVNSLPQVKYGEESDSEYADFSVIDREDPDEGNVCTEVQAAVAKAKGRRVRS